jgi:hypothetical protein
MATIIGLDQYSGKKFLQKIMGGKIQISTFSPLLPAKNKIGETKYLLWFMGGKKILGSNSNV